MASFSGATTPWRTASASTLIGAGTAYSQADEEANSTASNIAGQISGIRAAAESLAGSAQATIDSAVNFNASITGVTYSAPSYTSATLSEMSPGSGPTVGSVGLTEIQPFSGTLDIDQFAPAATVAPPLSADVTISDPPDGGSFNQGPPQDLPLIGGVILRPAPDVNISAAPVPQVAKPNTSYSVVPRDFSAPSVEGLTLPILDDSEITGAIDRLKSGLSATAPAPDYTRLIPEVFDVVGSLLTEDLVVDSGAILQQVDQRVYEAKRVHDEHVVDFWSRRGLSAISDSSVAEYVSVMDGRASRNVAANNGSALARWIDDSVRDAFSVGVAAHSMMIDIEMGLYDAEFKALITEAESHLEVIKGVASLYNGAVTRFNGLADAYAADLAQKDAHAAQYMALVDSAQAKLQLNAAIGDAFAASERAKSIDADLFKAQVGAEGAKVQALRAKMEAAAAQAATFEASLDSYKAEVLSWTGQIERAKADYSVHAARARGVVAKNQGESIKAQLSGSQNEAIAVEAQRIAAMSSARANELSAKSSSRSTRHITTEMENAIESLKVQGQVAQYEGAVARWSSAVDGKVGMLEGSAAENTAAARFFVATSEAAGRAATLTQQANIQLANAYAAAHEAAGRAGAAVASGKLSGYRASASISASGSLSARDSHTAGSTKSRTDRISESDTYAQDTTGE